MKGFFNKVTSQVKDLINTSSTKEGAPEKNNAKSTETSSFKMFSEELTKNLKRIGLTGNQKFTPKQRQEIIKSGLNSQKCFQLFQHLEKPDQDTKGVENGLNIYHKMKSNFISDIFNEKKQEHRDIDVTSQEIFDLISSSQGQAINQDNPLLCISVIGFHHEKGTIVEYSYPDLDTGLGLNVELREKLQSYLIDSGMPDAIHNANEDFVYFIIDVNKKKIENLTDEIFTKISHDNLNDHALLYGVSYFKQIPVTEKMREHHPDLVRSHVQKAVCVLSKIPIFGHLLAKLDPITKCYFTQDNFNETEILRNGFDSMSSSLKEITVNTNEIFVGTCVKKLVYLLQEKVVILWKALLLEKRILVYSQQPSACSTFIHSLISLIPCLCHFKYQSKALNIIENHYNEYGLPLHLFHEDSLLIPYFSVHNADPVASSVSFLAGTSNPFIKTLPSINWDILVDLDKNSIQFKNDALKKALVLTSQDLQFAQTLIKKVKSNKNSENLSWNNMENSVFNDTDDEFKGGEDWIRHKFYEYIMALLTEIEFFRYTTSAEKLEPLVTEYNNFMAAAKNPKQKDENKNWKDEVLRGEDDSEGEDELDEIDRLEEENECEESPTKLKAVINTSDSSQEDSADLTIQARKSDEANEEKKENKNVKGSDPKSLLKKELQLVKESGKTLKKFGIDWILKWTKTKNFAYWLENHSKIIGERSINNPQVKEHYWFYENGDIYFGDLAFAQRYGVGTFVDRDAKMAYIGDWEGNKRSGAGKLISIEDGEVIYEGGYKSNKKHGKGTYSRGNERYTGMLNMNMYEGNGVLVDKDKNRYEGDFREGLKWGVGKLQWANEDVYTGEFYRGKLHGKGQLVYKNGDFYSGDFREGLRAGEGVYQSAKGDVYEGQFENNLYEGSGFLKRADGYQFKGKFKKGGLEDGKEGSITYPNNAVYQGEIKNYKAHGEGVLKRQEENGAEVLEKGQFEDGNLVKKLSEEEEEKI